MFGIAGYVVIAAVVLTLISGFIGKAQFDRAEKWKTDATYQEDRKKEAQADNAKLVESIAGTQKQCSDALNVLAKQDSKNAAAAAAAKAQLATVTKKYAADAPTIAALDRQAQHPTGKDFNAQCRAAEKILTDLNKWRFQ